jgi:hypothetical protein
MAHKIFLRTAAFPKADVGNIGVGIALDGCFCGRGSAITASGCWPPVKFLYIPPIEPPCWAKADIHRAGVPKYFQQTAEAPRR